MSVRRKQRWPAIARTPGPVIFDPRKINGLSVKKADFS